MNLGRSGTNPAGQRYTLVSNYRAFCVTNAGEARIGEWLVAGSDEEAGAEALALCGPGIQSVALWLGVRLVATYVR